MPKHLPDNSKKYIFFHNFSKLSVKILLYSFIANTKETCCQNLKIILLLFIELRAKFKHSMYIVPSYIYFEMDCVWQRSMEPKKNLSHYQYKSMCCFHEIFFCFYLVLVHMICFSLSLLLLNNKVNRCYISLRSLEVLIGLARLLSPLRPRRLIVME